MLNPAVGCCDDCSLFVSGRCVFSVRPRHAGEVIWTQGVAPGEIVFVKSGVVALSCVSAEGRDRLLGLRGPRSVVGLELLADSSSDWELRVVARAELCHASVGEVALWGQTPEGARALLAVAVEELWARRRDESFRSGTMMERIARATVAFERALGPRSGAWGLTKAQLARLVGARPETVSRVLRRLEAAGLVDATSGVRVLRLPELQEVARE